jgi:hypothetical protein
MQQVRNGLEVRGHDGHRQNMSASPACVTPRYRLRLGVGGNGCKTIVETRLVLCTIKGENKKNEKGKCE